MRRIVFMALRCFFSIPFWIFNMWRYGNPDKYDEPLRYGYLSSVVKKVDKAGRITIDCHGLENVPKENGYIMFPNHQGLFDAFSFLETLDQPFSVVMKKETQKNFLCRLIIRILQGQVIDREDVRQSMKVIRNMANEVKAGRNYLIFAEGTRSKKGNQMGSLKGGSFKSATYAKCPIVPVALIDSFIPFDSNSIKPCTVHIHYLPPLYYDDYKDMKTTEIAEEVERRIRTSIAEDLKHSEQ